jgi:hypothetical protein
MLRVLANFNSSNFGQRNGLISFNLLFMNAKINKQFQRLEILKANLLKQAKNIDSDQFNQKPSPTQWSLGQVLHHLYLVEEGSYQYIAKKTKGIDDIEKSGFKEAWRNFLLRLMLVLPIKFKAPRVVSESMPEIVDYEKLVSDWSATRERIGTLLNTLEDSQLKLKLFKHPKAGYLNIIQTIGFVHAHHLHHLKQINGLLSNIQTPNN